jgi:hypothetical protein
MGRVASMVLDLQDAGVAEVEARLERVCSAFEAGRDDLRRRWDRRR